MARVLLLPEKSFASRERALLERLSVGLADEGARVYQGVPGVDLDAEDVRNERLGVFATPVPFADRGLPWTEGLRAGVLLEGITRAATVGIGGWSGGSGKSTQGLQIVHAFGLGTWELGWQTAAKAGARLVVEVFSGEGVHDAVAWSRRWARRGDGPAVWWNAADAALGSELARAIGGDAAGARVVSNPWGVHVPGEPHSEIDPVRTGTLVLWCGSSAKGGRDVRPLFEGLRARAESPRGLLVLANELTADRLGLWTLARSMDLSSCLSVVPELTERWDLTLEADALVIPSSDGEQHGFVLDAMAAGMPVVARADGLASHLIDQETAVLVREPEATAWRSAISEVLDQPERAVALGSSARQFVRQQRLASTWVAGVMKLYESALTAK